MKCYACLQDKNEMMAEGTAEVDLCYDCYCRLRERSRLYQKQIAALPGWSIRIRIQRILLNDVKRKLQA